MKRPLICSFLLVITTIIFAQKPQVYTPVLLDNGWRICNIPDLGTLNGDSPGEMHIVDHGFIQDNETAWYFNICTFITRAKSTCNQAFKYL